MTTPNDLPRIITIMGSGETAPTMVSTHRALVAKLPQPTRAVLLDTPYGFQENSSELSSKAVEYFDKSINVELRVAGLTRLAGGNVDSLAIEKGLQVVADAHYVFAGPGSPSYALRQWEGSPIVDLLTDKIRNGGVVTFASAAALTLGRFTLPVYEIYKVGQEPRWLDGLDLMSEIGLHVAVIPHYNNAEGGHHDTRFCYMGERRLSLLESELPSDVYVLGVDEHTGVVIDLDADTATVVGKSVATIRVRGASEEFASGTVVPLDRLRDLNAKTSLAKPVLSVPVKTVGISDVTVGDTNGLAFTGTHGSCTATNWPADWPKKDAKGTGVRGGQESASGPPELMPPFWCTSSRLDTAMADAERFITYGFRPARTAPEEAKWNSVRNEQESSPLLEGLPARGE